MQVVRVLCEQEEFQRKLQQLSSIPGEEPLKNNTRSTLKSGTVLAVKGVLIPARFLPYRLWITWLNCLNRA